MLLPFPVKAGSFKGKYMCVSVTALTHMAPLLISSHEPLSLCAVHCRNTERSPHLCYKLAFLWVRREFYCLYGTISDSREKKSLSFSYVGEFTRKNEMESDLLCNFAGMSVCSSTGMGFTVVPEHESEVWRKGIPVLKPDAEFFTTNHKKTRPSGWSELAELALQWMQLIAQN